METGLVASPRYKTVAPPTGSSPSLLYSYQLISQVVDTKIHGSKKKGKSALLPHPFVVRGDKREKVTVGEATLHEYIATLCQMTKVVEVPSSWKELIWEHVHQLTTMASDWTGTHAAFGRSGFFK